MFEDALKDVVTFHHIGIAVRDFGNSIKFYTRLGYKCSKPVIDNLQNADLVILSSNSLPSIELIKPVNEKSPVNNYLKNNGEVIYHICYEVNNLKKTLEMLKKTHRVICVSKQKGAILFGKRLVSFYYVNGVGIVEFLEK